MPPPVSMIRAMKLIFLAAPAFMVAYSGVRIIDGIDGEHGPGPAWTIGHLFFLVALVLFGAVLLGLRRMAPSGSRIAADVFTVVGLAGLATFIRVVVIDLIVGFKAADHAEKSALSNRYENDPSILPGVVYEIGPMFFQIGLFALLVLLAVKRRVPVWSPVLVLVACATLVASIDLLPVGAALMLAALFPLARGNEEKTAAHVRTA